MRTKRDNSFDRIIDANFNRTKEGLRVCEDICRFVFDDQGATRRYKHVRHQLTAAMAGLNIHALIGSRNITADVGRRSTRTEFKRSGSMDIYYANSQRVKESLRVLEEFTKLRDKRISEKLKRLRYRAYELEKNIIERC